MKRVMLFLTDREVAELQAITESTQLKFAEVIRRVLDKGLEESEPESWGMRKRAPEPQEKGE